ncbi:predicted protein [Naegleria gruberi]|uniref:ER membrane protein complex subunit 6 n=1 Tax=Naegleria gruberi TaxID=5762 RepID=D2UZ02_NAEGR|nr:uncharacterized protein NAEGRDRAFT_61766 [Naegleria gruberi]EFC50063.1 predicted protein [Naegleria gruberi]|eukprot:XP_002682807.1 predicted protein [Naegleria gruberi strain NEG-M]
MDPSAAIPSPSTSDKIGLDKIAHNDNVVYKCKIFISLVFGIVAGIFGLSGLSGFLFYILVSVVISSVLIGLVLPKPFSIDGVFTSWSNIIFGGFTQGLLTYILFWTISYDMVYIFF